MIGTGIAQRTIFAAPDELALSVETTSSAAVTVIDGSALNAFEGSQTVSVQGEGQVFAAYGRTTDVLAWIGDTTHNLVTFDASTGELVSKTVSSTETVVPNPDGSDLWLDDYVKDDTLTLTVNVPEDVSFIIASDGTLAAPSSLELSWPVDNSTPWSGPLIIGGAIVLLIGLGFLLWATNHMRSSRGPRRKMPKVPKKAVVKPAKSGRRASMIAVPVVLIGALVLSGCSADQPQPGAQPDPSASASGIADAAELSPPAVTARQVERIIAKISATVTEADAARDAEKLKTRVSGAALELRLANYTIRGNDATIAGLPAIPEGPVSVVLPQQTDMWPRTVFAVIQNTEDTTIPPIGLFLVQDDPRADYKVTYAITLEPAAVLPDLAPASVGASRLAADSGLLRYSPQDLALAYGEILELDVESAAYLDFEGEGDSLRAAVGLTKKNEIRASLPSTAAVEFGHAVGPAEPIALATNDAGAIVAVNLNETTTVRPIEAGAAINPSGQVKALSGIAISTKGILATYGDQLLFYVPAAGSDAKIVLLGYSQGLVSAKEIG